MVNMSTIEIGNDVRKLIVYVSLSLAAIMVTLLLLVAGHVLTANPTQFLCGVIPRWYWLDTEQVIVYGMTGIALLFIALEALPPTEKSLLFKQTKCYVCGMNIRMHYGNHTRACLRKLSEDMHKAESDVETKAGEQT
jgi:predicted membrane channel-forming protein YqfA (hemolysin III family)